MQLVQCVLQQTIWSLRHLLERQEEEPQEAPCAPPQAQDRGCHAQEDSILQEIIPQVIRHVDCQLYFNIMWNRYKAVIYLNGAKVQEMFDFSLQELKDRLRKRIEELDATCHMPLTEAVLWTTEPSAWDRASEAVQIQPKSLHPGPCLQNSLL